MPRSKKDPNKPKGVKSAYIFFAEHERENDTEGLSFAEHSKACGNKWAEMSDAEKAPFIKKSEKDRKRHEAEMKNYVPPQSDSDSDDDAPKKKKHKKSKDPNAPKRPTSAYFYFAADQRPALKKENPSLTITEQATKIGALWRDLDDDAKQPYQDKAEKDKQRYTKEMDAYNKR